ncbi:MAG: tyrosine-type recombinase/integrase [Bacilli bacterium]|nr:tyrosine-type recombinase/integrase [Bacilli bacterium]
MIIEELKTYKEQYIKKLEAERKASLTVDSYSYNLDRMISYIEKHNDKEFNAKTAILDYVNSIDPSYEATTINTRRSPVRGFISFMKSRDYIAEDFGGNIGVLKEDKPPKEVLEPKEIETILEMLSSELKEAEGYGIFFKARNLVMFAFLLYTGVRRGELVKVKWSDIDFIKNEIKVVGKGNKTRIIPLLPDLKQQLYMYRDILEQLDNVGHNVKSEYLFRSEKRNIKTKEKDSPMTPRNVALIVQQIRVKAGIEKKIRPHNVRHNFASYGIKNKVSNASMADVMGHSNISTFLNIYAHEISMEEKKKEIGKIRFDI